MAKSKQSPAQEESAGKKGLATYNVSPEEFCRVWTESSSADEVSEKLKMPKPIVHARASSYREKGIPLKKMPRRKSKGLDVESLKALVESLNAGESIEPKKKRGRAQAAAPAPDNEAQRLSAVVAEVMAKLKK